jgi:hypothetical protein
MPKRFCQEHDGDMLAMTRCCIQSVLCLALLPTAAQAKDIIGQYGFAGEWTLEATLSETAQTWYGSREWSGTARTRHTGLCSANGVPDDIGVMTMRISAVGRASVSMKAGALDCVYTGRLTKDDHVFADCQGGLQLPMTLWEQPSAK